MKTLKLLFAASAALFVSFGAVAADTPKAVLSNGGQTLTFVCDSINYGTQGKDWFNGTGGSLAYPVWTASCSNKVTTITFAESYLKCRPTSCKYWFYNFTKLNGINNIENLDVSLATDLRSMFQNCTSLLSVDVSQFDTANVLNMSDMFNGCSQLVDIYGSSRFSTAKVTTSYGANMFKGCSKLKGGNGTEYAPSNVSATYARIDGGPSSSTPGYFTAKEAKVVWNSTAKSLTFYYDTKTYSGTGLTQYSLPSRDGIAPKWVSSTPSAASQATKVVFDNSFKDYRPKYCSKWLQGTKAVTIDTLGYLNVSAVTNLSYLFANCSNLKSLDLTAFRTANVTKMAYLFSGCSALETIYATDAFSTTAVGTDTSMFQNCTSLKGGNGTTFKSAKVTNKSYAKVDRAETPGYFTGSPVAVYDSAAETLTFYADGTDHEGPNKFVYSVAAAETQEPDEDPSWSWVGESVTKVVFDDSFKNHRPKHCGCWFSGFYELTSVEGLANLDVSEATSLREMFSSCSKLTTLDLSSFDTAKVRDTTGMFNGCSALTKISVSDRFVTDKVTDSDNMFKNCSKLKGGNGTVYSASNVNKSYARMDASGTSGYFTGVGSSAWFIWDSGAKKVTFWYGAVLKRPTGTSYYSLA